MNLYPKRAHLCEFMTNLCQFILIFYRFILIYPAYIPHINTQAPVLNPKTNIPTKMNLKNLKNPNFP